MDFFLTLLLLATMFGLTASNPLLTVHQAMAFGTHISRDIHEINSADRTLLAGRLGYGTVATISLAILVACFGKRPPCAPPAWVVEKYTGRSNGEADSV